MPVQDENEAIAEIEDALFNNGYDITNWETLHTTEPEWVEYYIELEGLRPLPTTTDYIAGYEVVGVLNV